MMRFASMSATTALLSSLLLAAPVLAQSKPAPNSASSDDIIVTARSKDKARAAERRAVDKQARAITRTGDIYHQPIARFQSQVCPGILGLSLDQSIMMVDRIRFNAERIGLDIAKDDVCRPNILVAFVRNGQADIKALLNQQSYLFAGLATAEVNELVANPGPVHAWSITSVRSRHGEPVNGNLDAGQIPVMTVPMGDSHIFLATRLDIGASIVVIDIASINGMTIDQIADYASMRSFARTRSTSGDGQIDTILNLFDPGDAPRPAALSRFDIAYLKSIYSANANMPAVVKLSQVPISLRKEADETAGEAIPATSGDAQRP